MNYFEIAAFILYFVAVLSIGIYFFLKSKNESEKDYFLGGKNMSGLVAALSAGASDMSAWCLMGLPGAIYAAGLGQVWISVGLIIGTILAWVFIAPRLRVYAIQADDSITIPQFLTNRFRTKSALLRIVCAVVFVVAYCIYMASSVSACGTLFSTLTNGAVSQTVGMIVAAVIIVLYTMLGGFRAVCWTDFLQGMLMLAALMILPIIALIFVGTGNFAEGFIAWGTTNENYYNLLSSGAFDWKSISDILTGLAWGLGYFGMPHILVRYMSIKDKKEMRKSQIVGSVWTFIILVMASVLGLVAHEYLGASVMNTDLVFVTVVRKIFSFGALAFIGGILISAIVAASMSTADSQLLASSSAFASDIYKAKIRRDASDKEMVLVSRIVVVVIAIIALLIALTGSTIMALVSAAWSIFGAAFGPAILLSLYWKRFNYKGCVAGIITGFVVSILWMVLFNFEYYGYESIIYGTNLYEILPGFILSLGAAVGTSLLTEEPNEAVVELFEKVVSDEDLN